MAKFIEFTIPNTDDESGESLVQINVDQILTITRNPADMEAAGADDCYDEEDEHMDIGIEFPTGPTYDDMDGKTEDEQKEALTKYDEAVERYEYIQKHIQEVRKTAEEACPATIVLRDGHEYETISTYNEVMVLVDAATS